MQSNPKAGPTDQQSLSPADQYEATLWQHWRTQLHLVRQKPWLAATWLKQSRSLFQRFNRIYSHLCSQPRPVRRRLQRQLGATLAGTALALALANSPVQAADITVDGTTCTLVDAITAANIDAVAGGCTAGDGSDAITLGADVTLNAVNHTDGAAAFGLPPITSTMTIDGAGFTITRDSGASNFGFFRVLMPDGNLWLNNVNLTGSNNAGSAIDNRGILTLNNSTLSGNTSSDKGGAIDNQGILTLNNSTLSGNTATNDGGAIINRNTLYLSNSNLNNNTATGDDGGAIYNDANATVNINNSTFSANSANNGGAIYNNMGGTVNTSVSTFSNNTTDAAGSAIYNYQGAVTVSDSTLSGNNADSGGGAIYNAGNSTLTMTNSTLSGNNGSAFYNIGAATISASAVISNSASGSEGGGLYNSGTLTLTNSILSGNSAISGGAISNANSLTVTNSTFSDNTATTSGGAILNRASATLTLNSSTISGNTATTGGGIANEATLTLNRSLISGNSATTGAEISNSSSINGASYNLIGYSSSARSAGFTPAGSDIVPTVPLAQILVPTLADNNTPWLPSGLTTLSHALVSGSPAIDAAGASGLATDQRGVYRSQGAADDIGAIEALPFDVTLNGAPCNIGYAIIAANTDAAKNNCPAGLPGADTITLTDNVVVPAALRDNDNDNIPIGLPPISTTITIEGAGFTLSRDTNNNDDFGLLAVYGTGNLTVNDITITGGIGVFGAITNKYGTLAVNDSTISGNFGLLGGAISSKYGTVAINRTTLSNNLGKYGGAVTLISPPGAPGSATIVDSTITTNSGLGGAGGILNTQTLTITNSTISQNIAKYGGGGGILNGFQSLPGGVVTISGSSITGNMAQGDDSSAGFGGGIYNRSGSITLTGSTISGNSSSLAGGGIMNYNANNPTALRASSAKPALPAAVMDKLQARGIDAAQLQAWQATVEKFKTQATSAAKTQARPPYSATMTLVDSTVSNNIAGVSNSSDLDDGGGIANIGGNLSLTNSTLSGNSAPNNANGYYGKGGGIYNGYDGTLTLNNSTLSGNMAGMSGGAVYNKVSDATITQSTVVSNSAVSGGGIFNIDGTATLSGALISGNTASGDGDEIYGGAVNSAAANLLGDNSKSNSEAFSSFTPGGSDLTATSDGNRPMALNRILNTTLADNGGATQTHALVSLSPALNAAGDSGLDTDQRGTARPQGAADDIGAVEMPVATITIALDARPNLPTSLGFGGGLGRFSLDDPATDDNDGITNSRTFLVLPGSYAVTRNSHASWFTTDIVCTPSTNAVINLAQRKATLTVAADETVTCTYTVDRAVLIRARAFNDLVRRNTSLGKRNAGDPWLQNWAISVSTSSTNTVASGVTQATATPNLYEAAFNNLLPGSYTVCATLPNATWIPTAPSAVDPVYLKPCKTVTLAPGQTATVLFGAYESTVVASESFSPDDEIITDEDSISDQPYDPAEEEIITNEDGLLRSFLPLIKR